MDISHRYAGRFLLLSMTSRWPPGMLGILLDRRKRFQTHCPDNLCRASAGPSTYSSNRSWRSCSSRALGRSARTTPTAGGALAAGCAIAPCECRASKKVAARRKAHTLFSHLSSIPLRAPASIRKPAARTGTVSWCEYAAKCNIPELINLQTAKTFGFVVAQFCGPRRRGDRKALLRRA